MPELPEVETVRKGLSDCLKSYSIEEVEVCRERAIASPGGSACFIEMMKGLSIGEWERRGKYLLASLYRYKRQTKYEEKAKHFSGWLGVHLRMTGFFQWHEKKQPPCSYTRVRFWDHKGVELRFVDIRSFGQMWFVPPQSAPEKIITGLKKLGPEPFTSEFNGEYLKKIFQRKTRSIKSALLDQSVVAGVGNIYADESLFASKINPQKQCNELIQEELEYLCYNIKRILLESIREGGTTFSDFRDLSGSNGNYGDKALVYRRTGQACIICKCKITRIKIAGRSTHLCPNCQKGKLAK